MSKGATYEQDVLNLVLGELSRGNLAIDPKLARGRHKPAYFSRDRDKNIVFDVSIEVFRKAAAEPYLIWIWECNNYGHTFPVDDVEEFHAKLSQVGADRTKGTMITPVGFDVGAVQFARSKGIGLCRWIPEDSLVYLMEDSSGPQDSDILCALTTPDTTVFRFYGSFYGLTCDGRFTTDQEELLRHELRDAS